MTRTTLIRVAAGLLIACGFAADVQAQEGAAKATSITELVQKVRDSSKLEAAETNKRLEDFKNREREQDQLLADAQRQLAEADATSQRLSAQFDANEREITALTEQLANRAATLGELFGVTRQVAGDSATVFQQSMISAQYPEREEFLRTLAGAKELPSLVELERLWSELFTEIAATGEVVKYSTKIVQVDGTEADRQVVRIGPFIASTDGEFLTYLPGNRKLQLLTRELGGDYGSAQEELQESTEGYVRATVDPARGVILALSADRPNWIERIEEGELVGAVIIIVGVIGLILSFWQLIYLYLVRVSVRRQLSSLDTPVDDNPLGRVLLAFKGDTATIDENADVAELRISEAVLREIPRLERFQAFLRLAVAAGPLLGLIGTVLGMIITFQSITESGSSDPKLMANGIGQAMIATVLGLLVAVVLLFINALLASMSRQVVQVLDEQSTGLLAEMIEREQAASGKGGGPRHA